MVHDARVDYPHLPLGHRLHLRVFAHDAGHLAEVGGTQFTGYMAMMNLSAIIGYQLAPIFAERYNYQTIFYIAAVLETFVVLAALFIDPEETDRTLNTTAA